MLLTEQQEDTLAELVNIAFGRTATALSDLTGHRVLLEAPVVTVHTIDELSSVWGFLGQDLATVHQIFNGPVSGDALLVLDYQGAVHLVDLLADGTAPSSKITASSREVLVEVGNILLNACLGMFSNLLQVHISFSVPRVHLEDLTTLLTSLVIGRDELSHALVIHTSFRLRDSAVGGYLVIVLGVTSLDQLLKAVEAWARSQVSP